LLHGSGALSISAEIGELRLRLGRAGHDRRQRSRSEQDIASI
jgi:hypothetical protein